MNSSRSTFDSTFNAAAFGPWMVAFVRESNRLAGIAREPSAAEVAAHRGLIAAHRLTVENLQMFVRHVEPSAALRTDGPSPMDEAPFVRSETYTDLETIILAAEQRLWSPSRLHRLYMSLRPFTDANARSGRALWLWQRMRTPLPLNGPPDFSELRIAS